MDLDIAENVVVEEFFSGPDFPPLADVMVDLDETQPEHTMEDQTENSVISCKNLTKTVCTQFSTNNGGDAHFRQATRLLDSSTIKRNRQSLCQGEKKG